MQFNEYLLLAELSVFIRCRLFSGECSDASMGEGYCLFMTEEELTCEGKMANDMNYMEILRRRSTEEKATACLQSPFKSF